jgi:acyl-CoA synthetase (AMP-forming)/AMP-acid ligase II
MHAGGRPRARRPAFARATRNQARSWRTARRASWNSSLLPAGWSATTAIRRPRQDAFTADGYYRSGDLGYTLADSRFVFLTRMGDALRLGGFLVSPAEIEAAIQELPEIAACQVVAIPRSEDLYLSHS